MNSLVLRLNQFVFLTVRVIVKCNQCPCFNAYSLYFYAYSILKVNHHDLKTLLYESTSSKELEDYECQSCKKKTVAINTITFDCEPNILILHIQKADNRVQHEEELILDKAKITDIGKTGIDKHIGIKYKLFGIVHYYGNYAAGHYFAFAKHGDSWWKVDDGHMKKVERLSKEHVMPFMLFYEKIY